MRTDEMLKVEEMHAYFTRRLAEAHRENERLRAEVDSLRLTLGGRTFSAAVPEPIGCPMPGACAQVAEIERLRAALQKIDNYYQTGGDLMSLVSHIAKDALAGKPLTGG